MSGTDFISVCPVCDGCGVICEDEYKKMQLMQARCAVLENLLGWNRGLPTEASIVIQRWWRNTNGSPTSIVRAKRCLRAWKEWSDDCSIMRYMEKVRTLIVTLQAVYRKRRAMRAIRTIQRIWKRWAMRKLAANRVVSSTRGKTRRGKRARRSGAAPPASTHE